MKYGGGLLPQILCDGREFVLQNLQTGSHDTDTEIKPGLRHISYSFGGVNVHYVFLLVELYYSNKVFKSCVQALKESHCYTRVYLQHMYVAYFILMVIKHSSVGYFYRR